MRIELARRRVGDAFELAAAAAELAAAHGRPIRPAVWAANGWLKAADAAFDICGGAEHTAPLMRIFARAAALAAARAVGVTPTKLREGIYGIPRTLWFGTRQALELPTAASIAEESVDGLYGAVQRLCRRAAAASPVVGYIGAHLMRANDAGARYDLATWCRLATAATEAAVCRQDEVFASRDRGIAAPWRAVAA